MNRLYSSISFIQKIQNPCINCIHYRMQKITYPDDCYINMSRSNIGYCSMFGKQHLVTGELDYDCALSCRTNEEKCGRNGKYFKPFEQI